MEQLDTLVLYGSEVKAHDDGRIEGHLVLFNAPDASSMRDVFTKSTDFDIDPTSDRSTVLYHHGFDPVLKRKRLGTGKAEIGVDEVGVWIKHQLDLRDEYEAAIHQLAQKGKLGWSSGVPGHLVERKAIEDNAHLVTLWPLGKDASLTPTPADPRNVVGTLKSITDIESMSLEDAIKSLLKEPEALDPEASNEAGSAAKDYTTSNASTDDADVSNTKTEVRVMSEQDTQQEAPADAGQDNAMKTELAALKTQQDGFEKKFEESHEKMDKILKFMEDSPIISRSGYFTVDGGKADPEIKSVGDLLISVARNDVKRLRDVYEIKLQSTASGDQGGYLIPETTLTNLGLDISLLSGLTSRVRRVPVPTPSGKAPIRNYRVTPAGSGQSASASGVASQKRAEGGSYGNETVLLDEIQYDTTDFASGVAKATREQMRAAAMIENLLREAIAEDVANREEWAILRGTGAGEPLGVLNWAGLVLVTEDTGGAFAAADSDEMVSHFLAKGNPNPMWTYHNSIYTSLSPFVRENTTVQGNRGQMVSTVFHGYPHMPSQHLPLIDTDGYIVLGDWNKYVIFEFEGLYIHFSEHRFIDEGKVAWFFGKNIDGKPIMPDAITLADGSFQLSPFVAMDAT